MTMVSVLPHEALVRSFSFLGIGHDLSSVMLVCKSFNYAAHEDSIWKEGCVRKYGRNISEVTSHLYTSFYEMLKDDNSLGACPIRYNPGKCLWKFNSDDRFYCCLIRSVRWHRPSRTVQVFFDARGETDLREPARSGLWRVHRIGSTPEPVNDEMENQPGTLTTLTSTQTHKKGVLVYPEDLFQRNGHYSFCYANTAFVWLIYPEAGSRGLELIPRDDSRTDYTHAILFHVEQSLRDAFPDYCFENEWPTGDTEENELELWRQHVPQQVMERRDPPWWT